MAKPKGATTLPTSGIADRVTFAVWEGGVALHRVHPDQYTAEQFNPGANGNARFSPIKDQSGRVIPTLYGGSTRDCALMETAFHDVPYGTGLKSVDMAKLDDLVHSQVIPQAELTLVDLSSTALRKLGIKRTELIDTEKNEYPKTRQFAEEIYAACPDVQGLCWVSRQDDKARAVVLFEDRVPAGTLVPQGPSSNLLADPDTFAALVELAERIGVSLV
jgi:hypothetical protein